MANNDLSDEDKALFRANMRFVTPLKKSKKQLSKSVTSVPKLTTKHQKEIVPEKDQPFFLSDHTVNQVDAETVISYQANPLPLKRLKQLRQGQTLIQGRLDLHGLDVESARLELGQFIHQALRLKHRSFIVIHGKGGYDGKPPIIKNLVNTWLRQIPQVLAFHSATPKDGGSGAVYVLLRKSD